MDPGGLGDGGGEGVDEGLAGGFDEDGGEKSGGEETEDGLGGVAGVGKIVDDESVRGICDVVGYGKFAELFLPIIRGNAKRLDTTDGKLPGDDGRRDEPTTGDSDDATEPSLCQMVLTKKTDRRMETIPRNYQIVH